MEPTTLLSLTTLTSFITITGLAVKTFHEWRKGKQEHAEIKTRVKGLGQDIVVKTHDTSFQMLGRTLQYLSDENGRLADRMNQQEERLAGCEESISQRNARIEELEASEQRKSGRIQELRHIVQILLSQLTSAGMEPDSRIQEFLSRMKAHMKAEGFYVDD